MNWRSCIALFNLTGEKYEKKFLVMLVCLTFAVPATLFASVSDDQVTSIKLKEADGVSAQDTNSGSGVKTGHIQDGAVTDAKISGTISASKIATTGLNADLLDGNHASDFTNADQTLQANIDALTALVNAQTELITTLQTQVAVLNNNEAVKAGAYMKLDMNNLNGVAGPHVIFEGANVHVRDGSGLTRTFSPPSSNGLGNLIIGYNEPASDMQPGDRSGNHNLIIGLGHKFLVTANSGIVQSEGNTISHWNAVAISGNANVASGDTSVVIGGYSNIGTGPNSIVLGGYHNQSLGSAQGVVVGGSYNLASGANSTVTGGKNNTASGDHSSVNGGNGITVDTTDGWAAPGH